MRGVRLCWIGWVGAVKVTLGHGLGVTYGLVLGNGLGHGLGLGNI